MKRSSLWCILFIFSICTMCVLAVLPESDINRDGIVNLEDHAIMANEWLETGSQSSAEFRPICKAGKYTGDGYVFHPIELGIYPVHVVIRSSEQAEGRTGVEMINIAPSAGVDNIKWNQSSSTIRDDCGFYATGFFVEGDAAPVNKAGVEYFYVVYGYK